MMHSATRLNQIWKMDNRLKCNFKMLSYNVRGLNEESKRRSIFRYIQRKKIDVCFMQETHSSLNSENEWRHQWGGNIIFSHGARNARGVMILVRPEFDFKIIDMNKDEQGRLLEVNCLIQDSPCKLINVYAPNSEMSRLNFIKDLKVRLDRENNEGYQNNVIIGGDFNMVQDLKLDRKGGTQAQSDCYKKGLGVLDEIVEKFDLLDVWRIRHPESKRFTWRRKNPSISSRLDLWFVSSYLSDFVDEIDILPSIKSDHSPILLSIKTFENKKGPGHWKLNNTFLEDETYIKLIKDLIKEVYNEENQIEDKQVCWEYLKYKIRETSINFGKKRAKERRDNEEKYEVKLKELEEKIENTTGEEELVQLELDKTETVARLEEIDKFKTDGLILRSRCKLVEEGEKSNKFFLGQCSRNKIKSTMNKLIKQDGTETENQEEILKEQRYFYNELYTKRGVKSHREKEKYLETICTPTLTEKEKKEAEGMLDINELTKSMKSFKPCKSPGNDGITSEFYKKFWGIIGKHLLEALNSGYHNGKLSVSQRQAVITLLDKGKDRLLLKNWRPISMLNVDYKIGSKAIAERIKIFLPKLIHSNQVGYISGRQITSNIRSISDILHYTKMKNIPGILMNLDFEKAFDSVDWEFLKLTMKKFNFGDTLIRWITTFYEDISSCVINNGWTSGYFKLGRGVRQGDPLSPYLFILVTEILACNIRQDKNIKGIELNNEEAKLLQFADDTNGIVDDIKSGKYFLKVVEAFGEYSGLKLNKEKTEAIWLGSQRNNTTTPLGIKWSKDPIKTLGVYFSYNEKACEKLNFEDKLHKCERILNMWRQRNLTMIGKSLIIKTFIISQFLYISCALQMPNMYLSKLENMMFNFLWAGKKPKIKRDVLYLRCEEGGLNMLNIRDMIQANRINWVRRYLFEGEHLWKVTFREFFRLKNIDINILLQANYEKNLNNLDEVNKSIPPFYLELLRIWSYVGDTKPPKSTFLWYNKEIKVGDKSVFFKSFHNAGIDYVYNLIDDQGKPYPFEILKDKGLKNGDWLRWSGLMHAMGKKIDNYTNRNINNEVLFLIDENKSLSKANTKQIYTRIKSTHRVEKVIKLKKYVDTELNIKDIFEICHCMVKEIKTREIQFRFLHDIIANSYWLKIWKLKEDDICIFCNDASETILHLFWECNHIDKFWKELNRWLHLENICTVNVNTVFYGIKDELVCTVIFSAKRYIYASRVKETLPRITEFKNVLRYIHKIEFNIAKGKNTVDKLTEKWQPIINHI